MTYIWGGRDRWCYLFSVLDVFTRVWVGYAFDTRAGRDNARIISEYETYLEHNLAIGNATVTNRDSEPDKIKQLNSIIQSQQETILALTQQLIQRSTKIALQISLDETT